MESLNFIKGYGKVNPSDQTPITSPPTHHHHRRRRILVISALVLLTLLIASLIAALIHASATESEEPEPEASQLAPSDSLKTICAVTRYPDSCLAAILPLNSSPPSTTPLAFFNLSLHASLIQVSNLKTDLLTNSDPSMKDCADLFDDAASQLRRSAEAICVKSGKKVLTEMRISDMQTWISAAMTDQETCVDGVEETGSTAAAAAELKKEVRKSQEYMSNSLAILNNIQSLFKKFGLTMP